MVTSRQPNATLPASQLRSRLNALFALPLLYKVLFANSLVILLGATLGTYLATRLKDTNSLVVLVGFVLLGLIVSVVINYALLKFALSPLTRLRETMEQAQAGDMTSKAPVNGFDPDADSLAQTFNAMLTAIDELSKTRAIQILHAQEQERKRIARELHDETSQVLTSLLISLAMLEESLTSDTGRARIADTRALAHQTLRAVRNLSIDLRPSALDDLGLLPALRWYIKEYQQKCGIEVDFAASGLKERLPAEMETAIYRIIQESLTNTAKHAHAQRAAVTLSEGATAINVHIVDDGCGFDAPAVLRTPWQDRGLGLGGMMERASLLNGSVEIESQREVGTSISVHIPLNRAPQPEEPTVSTHAESHVAG